MMFYGGPGHWTTNRKEALDLESVERAAQVAQGERFVEAEIVLDFETVAAQVPVPIIAAQPKAPPRSITGPPGNHKPKSVRPPP